MRPRGGLNDCALAIRLRSTCTSRSSTAHTIRPGRRIDHQTRIVLGVARRLVELAAARAGSAPRPPAPPTTRDSSASSRDASLTSLISRSSRDTSWAMIVSNCLCRSGSSMRRRVSIALRIDDSGFLISCATSAANFSIASIRAHSACAESDSAVASAPTSSRRCEQRRRHAARPALALAHLGRGPGQAQDRPGDGQRQIPRQQHRQAQRQAEQRQDGHAHDEQAGHPPRAPRASAG